MTEDKKPRSAPRQEALRRRREAEGLKRLELWAHSEDHGPIKGYAAKLAKARAKSAPAKKKAAPKG